MEGSKRARLNEKLVWTLRGPVSQTRARAAAADRLCDLNGAGGRAFVNIPSLH